MIEYSAGKAFCTSLVVERFLIMLYLWVKESSTSNDKFWKRVLSRFFSENLEKVWNHCLNYQKWRMLNKNKTYRRVVWSGKFQYETVSANSTHTLIFSVKISFPVCDMYKIIHENIVITLNIWHIAEWTKLIKQPSFSSFLRFYLSWNISLKWNNIRVIS